jgi:hypothetical protein
MSVATAEPVPPPEPELAPPLPDGLGRHGLVLSAALHVVIGILLIFGFPTLFHAPTPQEMPIAVRLVTMGPETRATHPNPQMPRPEAKPELPLPGPPAEKPTPEAPPPTPAPPPSAAEAPPQPPVPAVPQPKPTPPAPYAHPTARSQQAELLPPPLPKPKPTPPVPSKMATETAASPPSTARPQPIPRSEAKAEARKYDPGQFDSLLRNLAKQDTSETPDAPEETTRVATGQASSQPRAPLGSQLSASEIDMIREQISRCWNIPAGAREAKDLVVEIRVVVLPDGNVQQAMIVDQGRLASDPFFRAAAESARRAFFNPLCRPLHLPPDKYEVWRDMVVAFSPKDVL